MFEVYEIVDNEGQDTIDRRWVVSKKEVHDGLKTSYKAIEDGVYIARCIREIYTA